MKTQHIDWSKEEELLGKLMPYRVRNILMISSLYDSFVFETDGFLADQIAEDFKLLNLSILPNIIHCSTPNEVFHYLIEMKKESNEDLSYPNIDLIIMQISSMKKYALNLLTRISEDNPDIPIIGLISGSADLYYLENHTEELVHVRDFFFWNGNSKLFLAIIKLWEDKMNLPHDNAICPVPVIVLVETYIPYYSKFLPLLYEEIMKLNREIIKNVHENYNQMLYMRARPRVFLFHQLEEAQNFIRQYTDNIIGLISNVNFRHHGVVHHEDGIKLIQFTRKLNTRLPVLIQSFNPKYEAHAEKLHAHFLYKNIPDLQTKIQHWLKNEVGFGTLNIHNDESEHLVQVHHLNEFYELLNDLPSVSISKALHHDRLSHWLYTHGEIMLSGYVRQCQERDDTALTRNNLASLIDSLILYRQKNRLQKWNEKCHLEGEQIWHIGSGSVGGKGRGLQFLNVIINRYLNEWNGFIKEGQKTYLHSAQSKIGIRVPSAVIIATDEFDAFMQLNPHLSDILMQDDEVIDRSFFDAVLPDDVSSLLFHLCKKNTVPLAVRSSSVLEDSISNPFAGIFRTFLLPNSHPNENIRFFQLTHAVKLVYASMFLKNARLYRESLHIPAREEKMAVIIQVIAGSQHHDYFYPLMSGVAQSYNFYPGSNMKHEDGIVSLSAGLGKTAVEREQTYAFCPAHPHKDFFRPLDIVSNAQKKCYVIDKNYVDFDLMTGEDAPLKKIRIDQKLKETDMKIMTSVWEPNEKIFMEGYYLEGPRVITYHPVLKYDAYPLAQMIQIILQKGKEVMGSEIEIEFAFDVSESNQAVFNLLQIRPIAVKKHFLHEDLNRDSFPAEQLVLFSGYALGTDSDMSLNTVVYIPPDKFNLMKTREMVMELEEINRRMRESGQSYILIGAGRWGSSDPYLGIPVVWSQISQAKVIVEVVLPNYAIEASHGSHFFHNLFSMNVGYLTIWEQAQQDVIHWHKLTDREQEQIGDYFNIVRFANPLKIYFDGKNSAILY